MQWTFPRSRRRASARRRVVTACAALAATFGAALLLVVLPASVETIDPGTDIFAAPAATAPSHDS